VTADGRFGFFFPGRVTRVAPAACAQLRGARAFALVVPTRASHQLSTGTPTDPAFWAACRAPRTRLVARVAGSYAIFAVG
jgi:hypothetical protein